MLLELVQEMGINPKKVSASRGGEFHSSCPQCGGKDRFIIWEKESRYWCRQCEQHGDAIQFCRDFLGMTFKSACERVGKVSSGGSYPEVRIKSNFIAKAAEFPCDSWTMQAKVFVANCSKTLVTNPIGLGALVDRGFHKETIDRYLLGWNPRNLWEDHSTWGLQEELKDSGEKRQLWLPKGIVIPHLHDNQVVKIKIRRADWSPQDKFPKYVEVSGSMKTVSIYGSARFGVLVESEMDAMLIQQVASDLCCSIAIGGSANKPDLATHHALNGLSGIFYSLDFDDAGKKAYEFWRSTYPRLRPWIIPRGKSPGDALKLGVDLRGRIIDGLKNVFQREVKDE